MKIFFHFFGFFLAPPFPMATSRDGGALPAPPGGSSAHHAAAAPSHHQQHRAERASKARGEVAELRAALASFSATGRTATDGGAAKREVFKKLVHYMTIGIDMSGLFMQVRDGERGGGMGEKERRLSTSIDGIGKNFNRSLPSPSANSTPPCTHFLNSHQQKKPRSSPRPPPPRTTSSSRRCSTGTSPPTPGPTRSSPC